ncbi:MAG TPA: hypothetical protein VLH17_10985 [Candidatus Binatia bacterium]|nr:hypothetical protein [Candidatus Binatia bacterium]
MSTYFAGPFQRKAMEKHDGEVTVASIWLAFYLCMVVGALFVNRNGSVVPLALFAAVIGGWGVLGWRRKKRASHIIQMDDATAIRTHHFAQVASVEERRCHGIEN